MIRIQHRFFVPIFVLLVLLQSNCFAVELWTQELRDWALQNYKLPFSDPAAATVANSIKTKFQAGANDSQRAPGQILQVSVSPSYLQAGIVPVFLGDQNSLRTIVIFPGIFANIDSLSGKRLRSLFTQRGFKVIYFPNPFSSDFISQKPAIVPASIQLEAELFYEALLEIRSKQKEVEASSVEIYGESYGALLGAAVLKLDSTRKNFIKRATLMSPPADMNISNRILDQNINEFQSDRDQIIKSKFRIGLDYLKAKSQEELPKSGWSSVAKARALFFILGFQEALKGAANAWIKTFDLRLKLADNLNFEIFGRELVGESVSRVYEGSRNLNDLVLEGGHSSDKIRVMTSQDDMINENADSFRNGRIYNQENLILLPLGGHLGFTGGSWFEEFLTRSFKN